MPSAGGSNPVIIVVNKLPLGEVMRAVLVVLGLIGGAYFLWRIQEILFLLFVAILLATAIEPIVNRLRRGPFSRGSGVIVVYTAIILMIALAAYLAVPTALGEGTAFVENLPQRLQTLRGYTQQLQPAALRQAVLGALDEFEAAAQSPGRPRQDELVAAGTTAAQTIISFVFSVCPCVLLVD